LGNPSDSWKPAFPKPLLIGSDYQLTSNSQLIADSLLVLHFVLDSISQKGNPVHIISAMLGGFLQDESFAYEEVIFDLASNELTLKYANTILLLVQSLEG
jgi:hypothetical protein